MGSRLVDSKEAKMWLPAEQSGHQALDCGTLLRANDGILPRKFVRWGLRAAASVDGTVAVTFLCGDIDLGLKEQS